MTSNNPHYYYWGKQGTNSGGSVSLQICGRTTPDRTCILCKQMNKCSTNQDTFFMTLSMKRYLWILQPENVDTGPCIWF